MKTILIPTDFSKNAFVAAEYGCSLAAATQQRVLLFHAYIALYSGYNEDGNSRKQIEWAESESEKQMENLVKTLKKQFPTVDIEGEYIKGFMIDIVVDKLKGDQLSLVVMGTKGVSNVTESMLGSTTYEVIKKSPIPVLVVPTDTPDFAFEKAGFFTDYNDSELDALLKFRQAIPLSPQLAVLHLYTDGENHDAVEKSLSRWERKTRAAFPDEDFSFKAIPVEKVNINAVSAAAMTERLNLMIFPRPHKSLFQNMFVPSLTKEVAGYSSTIPSLFIRV